MGRESQLRHAVCAFFLASGKASESFSPILLNSAHKSYHSTNLSMSGDLPSPSAPSPPQMDRAKKSIATAISIGAPAYNSGDIPKCASVYKETALQILPMLPQNLRSQLEATTKETFQDSNQAAWAFRTQFDAIMDYQPPFLPSMTNTDSVTLEVFTDTMIPLTPRVVNDNVMGGVSEGEWLPDSKTFRGRTSLANNGGFSSLRWRFDRIQNWSYARGIYLKVKHSDPSTHTFSLLLKDTTCERIRLTNYKNIFANPDGTADHPIFLPFDAFDTIEQMGQRMSGGPGFNRAEVTEVGLMAIKPTVVGEFQLQIEEWGLYS